MADNDINWEELMKQDDFWTHAFKHDRFKQLSQQRTDAEKAKSDLEKQLADMQKQAQQAEQAKLTDLEKVQRQMEAITAKFEESQQALVQAERQRERLEVATELGLPSTLAARLVGSTREEMVADAQTLLPLVKPTTPGNPPPPPRTPAPLPFTKEQLSDPEFVRKNQNAILKESATG